MMMMTTMEEKEANNEEHSGIMEGELRAAEEKLKREHKEMKEAARAKIKREKKILVNVQAACNRQSAARINAPAHRPQEKPKDEPAPQFVPLEMKSGEEVMVTARDVIKMERRILAAMLIEDALMPRERRPHALMAQEEKDGALGDGEEDEGLLGQSKINLYIEDSKLDVVHLDLEAARTRKPELCLSESAIEDIMRIMNKRSCDAGDGHGNGSSKELKKRNRSQPRSRTDADHEEGSEEEEETETDDTSDDESCDRI